MKVDVEFKYFDKDTCSRCKTTNIAVQKSLNELKAAAHNLKILFKEIRLPASQMHLSPSVVINGQDIGQILGEDRLKKNTCGCCSALVGKQVECRTFFYKGDRYDYIPKEMIMEAIRKVTG